jgi:hypothetical protein
MRGDSILVLGLGRKVGKGSSGFSNRQRSESLLKWVAHILLVFSNHDKMCFQHINVTFRGATWEAQNICITELVPQRLENKPPTMSHFSREIIIKSIDSGYFRFQINLSQEVRQWRNDSFSSTAVNLLQKVTFHGLLAKVCGNSHLAGKNMESQTPLPPNQPSKR